MPVVGGQAAISAMMSNRPRKYEVRLRASDLSAEELDRQDGVTDAHRRLTRAARALRDHTTFQRAIICVIFLAGLVVGIQTYDISSVAFQATLDGIDTAILVIFVAEVVVKLVAEGTLPWRFFKDGWNTFDFLIVAVSLMPFDSGAVTALRLVRLLRVLKLVRALPKLRVLVMGLLKSLSSIAYIGLLLLLLFYLYAVLGVSLFGENDPVHMGTLHIAFVTLFRCATLEDWTDVMYIAMYGCDEYGYDGMEDRCTDPKASRVLSVVYFVTFVVLSAMMILNLFIGVITSSIQDAKSDLTDEIDEEAGTAHSHIVMADELDELMQGRLEELAEIMRELTDEIDYFQDAEAERVRVKQELAKAAAVTKSKRKTVLQSTRDKFKALRKSTSGASASASAAAAGKRGDGGDDGGSG